MRFLAIAKVPHETGNAAIRDSSLPRRIQSILQDLRPAATYFGASPDGQRCIYTVVNIPDGSQVPAISEPFFLGLNAKVQLIPVFTPEELQEGAQALPQIVRKHG